MTQRQRISISSLRAVSMFMEMIARGAGIVKGKPVEVVVYLFP